MEDLMEVLTYCEFHPSDPSTLLYCSSKGYFSVCDLRASPNTPLNKYNCVDYDGNYSEIVSSVTNAKFMKSTDTYMVVSRDYLYLRIWDLRQPSAPLSKIRISPDYLTESSLPHLYDNDAIFDRFDVGWSPSGKYVSTGGYN